MESCADGSATHRLSNVASDCGLGMGLDERQKLEGINLERVCDTL